MQRKEGIRGFCLNPPPGAQRRWHCSMTRDSSRCYSSSQTNAASPSPPASAKIVKLKSFRPTVLISPLPSYLKIKGLFIRYFHPISGSFESFKIKVFFPKRSNEVSGSWVCLEGWQGCCSTPWKSPGMYLKQSHRRGSYLSKKGLIICCLT